MSEEDYEEEDFQGYEEDFYGDGQAADEPAGKRAERKPEDHAVKLGTYLMDVLRIYGELPPADVRFKNLAAPGKFEKFAQEIQLFTEAVVSAMARLPASPGHKETTKAEENALRRKFIPVNRSYMMARKLLGIAVPVSFHKRKVRASVHQFVLHYFKEYEGFYRYTALRSWLYRRNPKYVKWASGYYARPEIKERIKKNRPSKDAESVRQRKRYWAKKGMRPPEETRQLSLFQEDYVILQVHETAVSTQPVVEEAPDEGVKKAAG